MAGNIHLCDFCETHILIDKTVKCLAEKCQRQTYVGCGSMSRDMTEISHNVPPPLNGVLRQMSRGNNHNVPSGTFQNERDRSESFHSLYACHSSFNGLLSTLCKKSKWRKKEKKFLTKDILSRLAVTLIVRNTNLDPKFWIVLSQYHLTTVTHVHIRTKKVIRKKRLPSPLCKTLLAVITVLYQSVSFLSSWSSWTAILPKMSTSKLTLLLNATVYRKKAAALPATSVFKYKSWLFHSTCNCHSSCSYHSSCNCHSLLNRFYYLSAYIHHKCDLLAQR